MRPSFTQSRSATHRLLGRLLQQLLAVIAVAITITPQASLAAETPQRPAPYVVLDDHGGSVRDRYAMVRALERAGRPVEIRGAVCYSSCTMMLGLKDTCVRPDTVFGFHGPSRRGMPLPRAQFDMASRIIASQYPATLRTWYMTKARYTLSGMEIRTGAQLIAMGLVRPCDDAI